MWIPAARTTGDTGVSSELVLESTDVGVLWRKLNRMLGALHLLDPHLRLAHRDLPWIVRQLIDIQEGPLHLLGSVALQHMHRHATSLGLNDRRAALLELIANCHHRVGLISGARGGRWETEFTNGRLKLLARDAVRQDSELWELTDLALIIISVRRLIPLSGHKCTAHRSSDRLVIHLRDGGRHGVVAPAAPWSPASTRDRVALKCANHWGGGAAWSGLNVACLLAITSPTTTSIVTTIASITPTAATIVTWR